MGKPEESWLLPRTAANDAGSPPRGPLPPVRAKRRGD
jgi:hypothetical protein